MEEEQRLCYRECPVHSPTRDQQCNYNLVIERSNSGEPTIHGEPCRHPDIFKTLVIQSKKGELVASLVDKFSGVMDDLAVGVPGSW